MSHSIIIISQKADCVALAFPSLATNLSSLVDTCNEAEKQLSGLSTPLQNRLHGKMHEVQDYLTNICDTPSNYTGQETQITTALTDYENEINSML